MRTRKNKNPLAKAVRFMAHCPSSPLGLIISLFPKSARPWLTPLRFALSPRSFAIVRLFSRLEKFL